MSAIASVSARVLDILSDVTGSDDVRNFPDIELYGLGIIDSLATVSLMLAFEEAFGIEISPAEFDRDSWATPRQLVADVERRLAAVGK
jgi:D-alanine--poly(phosphoribitol) ligase subunit 2